MIPQLQPRDFAQWVLECQQQGMSPLLLDVREAWELDIAKVTPQNVAFVHTPMQQIPKQVVHMTPDQPVAVLCHHGMRSMRVAEYLQSQGFTQVCNIAGGIDAWASQVDAQLAVY